MDIIAEFTNSCNRMVDECAGTFYVARFRIPMAQQRKFAVCDLKPSFVAESLPHLVTTYARQVLKKESSINAKYEEVFEVSRT